MKLHTCCRCTTGVKCTRPRVSGWTDHCGRGCQRVHWRRRTVYGRAGYRVGCERPSARAGKTRRTAGLQNVIERGYDPREAPKFCKMVIERYGDRTTSKIWSSHDSSLLRGSFLTVQLMRPVSESQFEQMKRDSSRFGRCARQWAGKNRIGLSGGRTTLWRMSWPWTR